MTYACHSRPPALCPHTQLLPSRRCPQYLSDRCIQLCAKGIQSGNSHCECTCSRLQGMPRTSAPTLLGPAAGSCPTCGHREGPPGCGDVPMLRRCPTALHPHSQAVGEAGALLHRGHDGIVEAIGSNTAAQGLGSLGMRVESGQELAKGLPPRPRMNLSCHCAKKPNIGSSSSPGAHSLPSHPLSLPAAPPGAHTHPHAVHSAILPLHDPVAGQICPKELD